MHGGNTGAWACANPDKVRTAEEKSERFPFTSYAYFIEDFDERFGEKNEAEKARHALATMQQGKRSFKSFEDVSGFDETALTTYLLAAINKWILCRIYSFETLPPSLKLWKQKIINVDMRERNFVQIQNINPASLNTRPPYSTTPVSQPNIYHPPNYPPPNFRPTPY